MLYVRSPQAPLGQMSQIEFFINVCSEIRKLVIDVILNEYLRMV